mmetsp:Transcript_37007/g.35728  ORF Transcript_37007/g.35728 Transcript_37007/m.35728 type:complete len:82 (-) Transcript_37007:532-777(-)
MQRALQNLDIYENRDEQRKALIRFYGVYYTGTFMMIVFFQVILMHDFLIILFSGCLWITQIVRNYQTCSRDTPKMSYALIQ